MAPQLSAFEINEFIHKGFVRLDNVFPRKAAEEARGILWHDTRCDPLDRASWTRPVIRLASYLDPPFREVANAPLLRGAIDQLAGTNRWAPLHGLGTFPLRFPSPHDPGDTGWHVDASYPPVGGADASFISWRVNVRSKGRALLLLVLFSDVGDDDAPTRIRVGSHLDVARILAPAGDAGLSFLELAKLVNGRMGSGEALATGTAGTVYLCHPFLVHAAQPHRGQEPRFMAQPPVGSDEPFRLAREETACSPAEMAVRLALG